MLQLNLSDLGPKRDVDIPSNYLQRAVADLQEMNLRYGHLLKENQQVEADREAVKVEERSREACNNAEKVKESMKECEKTINEQYAYIACLLMKLSSSEEQAKELRKQVKEGRKRNEELLRKLKESKYSQFSEYSLHVLNCSVFALKVRTQY